MITNDMASVIVVLVELEPGERIYLTEFKALGFARPAVVRQVRKMWKTAEDPLVNWLRDDFGIRTGTTDKGVAYFERSPLEGLRPADGREES